MSEDEKDQILESIKIIYGNRPGDLLDDLRFLHEYRLSMRAMGGWVMRATVVSIALGVVAAAWAGIKLMVTKS